MLKLRIVFITIEERLKRSFSFPVFKCLSRRPQLACRYNRLWSWCPPGGPFMLLPIPALLDNFRWTKVSGSHAACRIKEQAGGFPHFFHIRAPLKASAVSWMGGSTESIHINDLLTIRHICHTWLGWRSRPGGGREGGSLHGCKTASHQYKTPDLWCFLTACFPSKCEYFSLSINSPEDRQSFSCCSRDTE